MNIFLPSPRVPSLFDSSRPPVEELSLLGVSDAALEPLFAVLDAYDAAMQAIANLEDARPGGGAWRAALDADLALVEAGKPATALQRLQAGEYARYSTALARCRLVAITKAEADSDDGLKAAVRQAATVEKAAALEAFSNEVLAGWAARNTSSKAWGHREAADEAWTRWRRAYQAVMWADGELERWTTPDRLGVLPSGRPGGYWLALKKHLDGHAWLTLPQGYEWPPEFSFDGAEARGVGIADLFDKGHRNVPETDAGMRLNALRS